jgi:hypothetical protein
MINDENIPTDPEAEVENETPAEEEFTETEESTPEEVA